MAPCAFIFLESPEKLWGLSSRQRLQRVLKVAGVTDIVEDLTAVPDNSSLLLLRGDYLFDDRVIDSLVETPNILLRVPSGQSEAIVAAHVPSLQAMAARDTMEGSADATSLPGIQTETLKTIPIAYQRRLRKLETPFVLPITSENCEDLEKRLFAWSYKGVTDLVTKWAWPRPARWGVKQCVRLGLRPNHVTMVSLILVVFAGAAFSVGQYGWGLLAGWLMTYLDTVDGKLARVTVTSSSVGHYFDHLIDLIHPPLWYIAWGVGLQEAQLGGAMLTLNTMLWLMLVAYIGGRIVEGAFRLYLGEFGIFCWQRIDSYFRLITARRNPCMILLTVGTALGRPELGLVGVTCWTVLTSLILLARFIMARRKRNASGPLRSWFLDIDQAEEDKSLAVRLFTR